MISDRDRIEQLERAVGELARQLAGAPVRLGDTASGGAGSAGSETLGCYLQRVEGVLTVNPATLFSDDFVLGAEEPCPLVYVNPEILVEGPPGGTGPTGPAGPEYGGGYCVVVDNTFDTIHLDQITTDPPTDAVDRDLTKFQLWHHAPGATVRTDAKWLTVDAYDTAAPPSHQLPGHEAGTWNFRTLSEWLKMADDYNTANVSSFVVHFDGAATMPRWKPATGYETTSGIAKILQSFNGSWSWVTKPEGEAGLLIATDIIPGRTGASPGGSTDYSVVLGSVTGTIYNYSTVSIAVDSYIVVVKIAGDWVIFNAFCD